MSKYQELENRALEEFDEMFIAYGVDEKKFQAGTKLLREIKDFLKSHLQSAYEAGKQENFSRTYKSSQMYLMGFEAGKTEGLTQRNPNIHEAVEQAKQEERERIEKWVEEKMVPSGMFPLSERVKGKNTFIKYLIQYLQNNK